MSGSRKGSEICTEGVGELDKGVGDLHGRGRRAGCPRMPGCLEGVGDLHGRGRRAGCQAVWKGSEICLEGVGVEQTRGSHASRLYGFMFSSSAAHPLNCHDTMSHNGRKCQGGHEAVV